MTVTPLRPDIAEYLEDQLAGSTVTGYPQGITHSQKAKRILSDKTVLLTGAGGSIGSELCRQVLYCHPRRVILFELSEAALYEVEQSLRTLVRHIGFPAVEIVPVLGSVIDCGRLDEIFEKWSPDTVFHAAAYKHVPLVEANPLEGIRNNLIGTWEIARMARKSGTRDFIFVSTDKAVRPTNVMGATKRSAEQIIQAHASENDDLRYSIVRFGNVLGSSGSVVPLFRDQIKNGGPITLTHYEVARFFMTISQAAQLVIEAGGMASGGEVFLLDMGEAVRIADLAKKMIQLSGLSLRDAQNPQGDIEIREIGLRPGEKLYEELTIGKNLSKTSHDQILMARENHMTLDELQDVLGALRSCSDKQAAIEILKQIVPEFEHERDNDRDQQAS